MDVDIEDPSAAKLMIDRGLAATLNPRELTNKPENLKFSFDPECVDAVNKAGTGLAVPGSRILGCWLRRVHGATTRMT
jgi:hypothetical protein